MQTVFDEFHELWPKTSWPGLKTLLKDVYCVHYPSEAESLQWANKKRTIIIIDSETNREPMSFWLDGYEHVIHSEREDFAQEILVSALMVVRPEAFSKNPMPFFFTGFQPPDAIAEKERHLVLEFHGNQQKTALKEALHSFVEPVPKIRFVLDVILQVADEMITNAIFNAPVLDDGRRPFLAMSRVARLTLPENKVARLFACYSDKRIILGCEDPFGSLSREQVLKRLLRRPGDNAVGTQGQPGGTGLGMKLMVENAANLYLYSEHAQKTVIACAFLMGGRRSNMTSAKHLHFSVR